MRTQICERIMDILLKSNIPKIEREYIRSVLQVEVEKNKSRGKYQRLFIKRKVLEAKGK